MIEREKTQCDRQPFPTSRGKPLDSKIQIEFHSFSNWAYSLEFDEPPPESRKTRPSSFVSQDSYQNVPAKGVDSFYYKSSSPNNTEHLPT
jgi:hypothetical protein